MSRFYASIEGNRGPATRQGTEKSGMTGHVRGWGLGARVYMDTDSKGQDRVTVYVTGGSNGRHPDTLIYQATRGEDGELIPTT